MTTVRLFLRQYALWAGLIVVIIPLLIILWLQYRSYLAQERTAPPSPRFARDGHARCFVTRLTD
jgi:hypothetical protein